MGKAVKILFSILVLFIGSLFAIERILPIENYRDKIAKAISADTNMNFVIEGKVDFKLLPKPRLILNDVSLLNGKEKVFDADLLDIKFRMLPLIFHGSFSPESAESKGVKINYEVFKSLIGQNNTHIMSAMPQSLKLYDVIVFNNKRKILAEVSNLELKNKALFGINIDVNSNFTKSERSYIINTNISSNDDFSNMTLNSIIHAQNFALKIKAAGSAQAGLEMSGELGIMHTKDISDNGTHYLSGQFSFKDDILELTKLEGNADYFKNLVGTVSYNNNTKSLSLNIEADKMLFSENQIMNTHKNAAQQSLNDTLSSILNVNMIEHVGKMNINGSLNIKSMNLYNKDIKNVVVELVTGNDGVIKVQNASMELPENGIMTANGDITLNDIRAKFDGDVSVHTTDIQNVLKTLNMDYTAYGKSLNGSLDFKSKLMIMPNYINLYDMQFSLLGIDFGGFVTLKKTFDEESPIFVSGNIELKEIDVDAVGLTPYAEDLFARLYASDKDKNGLAFNKLMDDFMWLREFNQSLCVDLEVQKLQYNKVIFDNFRASIDLKKNSLNLERAFIMSDDVKMMLDLNLTLPGFKPLIEGNVYIDYVNFNTLPSKILPNISIIKEKANKYKELLAQHIKIDEVPTDINFFGAANYDTKFQILGKKATIGENNLSDFNMDLEINGGLIRLNTKKASMFEGNVSGDFVATAFASIPSFNIGFVMQSINPKNLFKNLFGVDKISGIANINGTLSATIQYLDEIYSKLNGDIKFAGSAIDWDGVNLNEIVKTTEAAAGTLTQKKQYVQHSAESGVTSLDSVNGTVKILDGISTINDMQFQNNRISGTMSASYSVGSKDVSTVSVVSFIPTGEKNALIFTASSDGKIYQQQVKFNLKSVMQYLELKTTQDDQNAVQAGTLEDVLKQKLG